MKDVLLYISAFFMVFLSCAVVCFCLRFSMWIYLEYWSPQMQQRGHMPRRRCQPRDRQGNAFPTPEDNSRESRYNDIFFIEPNSVEAARIRAQLEKDDKDLPSYEDVIRMTSVDPPNSALATMTASNASVNTTETILSVPPYSEVDPNASSTSVYAATALPTTPPPFEAASVVPITLSTASSSSVTHHSSNV